MRWVDCQIQNLETYRKGKRFIFRLRVPRLLLVDYSSVKKSSDLRHS